MLCSLEQGCNSHRGTAVEIASKPASQLISRKGRTQRCYLAVGLLRCSIKSRKLGSKSSIWAQGCWIRYVEWERTVMSMTMLKAGTNTDFFCSCSTPTLYLYQHIWSLEPPEGMEKEKSGKCGMGMLNDLPKVVSKDDAELGMER